MTAAVTAICGRVRAVTAFHAARQLDLGRKICLQPFSCTLQIFTESTLPAAPPLWPFLPCTRGLVGPSLLRAEESSRQDFERCQWGSKGITGTSCCKYYPSMWVNAGRQPEQPQNYISNKVHLLTKVNLFHYLCHQRIPKQHLSGDTQVGMLALLGSVHPSCWHPFTKDELFSTMWWPPCSC